MSNLADNLAAKNCLPCTGDTPRLTGGQIENLLPGVPGWKAVSDRLERRFEFPDFRQAMGFVNRMADIANAEDHHPDFAVHYNKVDVTIWTHAVGGLSENDFILAAKLGAI
jgi:4a-hydroxytetrahydrobiopterin dehydratase